MIHRLFVVLVLALLAAALAMTAAIWRHDADGQVQTLREERYRFSLGSLKDAAESGLKLGADTGSLPGIPALIAEIRTRQRDILSVELFDAAGQVRLSSDRTSLGLTEPRAWREPCLAAAGQVHAAIGEDARLQCVALRNAFDQVVGGIVVRYGAVAGVAPGTAGERPLEGTGVEATASSALAGSEVVGALVLLLLLTTGAFLIGRSSARTLQNELETAHRALHDDSHGQASALLGPLPQALRTMRERRRRLEGADRELDDIDEIGTR